MFVESFDTPCKLVDADATFSKLAGVDPADSHPGVPDIDSIDAWPAISGTVSSSGAARSEIFIGSGVLIQGPYKLIATGAGVAQWSGPRYPKVSATGPKSLNCSATQPCLFDVETGLLATSKLYNFVSLRGVSSTRCTDPHAVQQIRGSARTLLQPIPRSLARWRGG